MRGTRTALGTRTLREEKDQAKGAVTEHLGEKEHQETGVLAAVCKKFSEGNQ